MDLMHWSGDRETVETFRSAIGKEIATLRLGTDDALHCAFTDGSAMKLFDDGQRCYETRYMQTDDDLQSYVGATLMGGEIRESQAREEENGNIHEIQFLLIHTSRGTFTMATHNEHNGYYGGFLVQARVDRDEDGV